jgi:hypothetical protein
MTTTTLPAPRALAALAVLFSGLAASTLPACRDDAAPRNAAAPEARAWQVLASELPSALLSVSGRSASDVFAVGADKGHGPLVLHFDGKAWKELRTGQAGDLWWVQALPNGPALMSGANGMVLRYDGTKFERMKTPGLGRHTVYGVWGTSGDDFYAVGSAGGRSGFVWHYHGGAFDDEVLPRDVPRVTGGEVPGFFKAWGTGDEVWVVGAGGAILHRKGTAAFTVVPSPTKDTLFTAHGVGSRLVTVGGAGNGVLLVSDKGAFRDASPPGAGLIQGVFATDHGDWASGERGLVFTRAAPDAAFAVVDTGLPLPAASSLHSIFVDASGGVWSAGGNVLTPALDNGMLVHFGEHTPPVVIEEDEAPKADAAAKIACPADVVAAGKAGSIARRWDEQALAAIRRDLPRPTVHARNLFHLSAAMWDAWAGYDARAKGVFVTEHHAAADVDAARRTAISYAAYDVLAHRYEPAIGGATTLACLRAVMTDLGLDPNDAHVVGDDPIAFGNRVGYAVVEHGKTDGANEAEDYADPTFELKNPACVYDAPGTKLDQPALWQPINLSVAATQNGIILPAGVQAYIGARWGGVTPFAMKRAGGLARWPDPGPAPTLGPAMKDWVVEVIRKTASVDPQDPTTIDISPGAYGHNALGANDGKGWSKNPVTGAPYPPQVVRLGDFARVMAEFWADGPKSETPPGHWNTLANAVSDAPGFARKLFGKGAPLDPLAWDVHVYLALNGAEHDAAIAAWGIKRQTTTVRPLSLVRWMGGKGQSSDPKGPSYDPDGLPLVPGLIEVITPESSAPGQRHARLAFFVGQIAVRNWLGEPGDRAGQVAGVGWVRAVDWITYQRRTFVTPAFPAFISGHSTFSRAGAEVLATLTGSPYFPGGLAEYVAPKDTFLTFEKGPSSEVRLQWASYYDASDQAGQSRLWGSIHIAPDDFAGRRVGSRIGKDAVALATKYFDGKP